MKLEEFNPAPPEININGKVVEFNKFRLIDKAWATLAFSSKEQPNGLQNLANGLQNLDAVVIARLAWRLVKNKRDIDEEAFYDYAEKQRNLMEILTRINQILEQSQPSTKVNDRMRELKKS